MSADWRSLRLVGDGRSLVEASAGTGKTWTIAMLYLRLLLEQGLTPRQMVVATFSEAAAAELQGRLRQRLRWAQVLAQDASFVADPDKPDQIWLDAQLSANDAARAKALQRLNVALTELDLAPIGTLHAWCSRIQRQFPFAAGTRFEPAEIVSGEALNAQLALDVRRVLASPQSSREQALSSAWGVRPPPNAKEVGMLLSPGNVVAEVVAPPPAPSEWIGVLRAAIDPGLHWTGRHGLRNAWIGCADCIAGDSSEYPDAAALGYLLKESFDNHLSKAGKQSAEVRAASLISREVHDHVDSLRRHRDQSAWRAMQDWLLTHKRAMQARSDQRTFDDLIGDVHAALLREAESGEHTLADAVHAAWPVALVDEFQDTDGIQYDILDRIYRDQGGEARGRLLMIGDPKQAIYRFRGGDIHAYQRAAAGVDADDRIHLRVNQRSSGAYVDAVNALYAATGKALDARGGASGITYEPVEASGRREGGYSPADGALQIRMATGLQDDVESRRASALKACANDILCLLQQDAAVKPGDIAVLLHRNADIDTLRGLLEARNVPVVTMSRRSVFDSSTAMELQVILHAAAHPEDLPALRTALATELLGLDYAQIRALGDDPAAWVPHARRFAEWHARWRNQGVLALVEAMIGEFGAAWLSRSDGERTLTDLRHLGEVLQAQSAGLSGMAELIAWLQRQREAGDDDEAASQDRQLRLESEGERVRLMTLHASKGLEFPIVFLPLMWAHGRVSPRQRLQALSREDGGRWLHGDGSADELAAHEEQDERHRLLYVALTRAEYACHVYALPPGRPSQAGSNKKAADCGTDASPLDLMLHRLGIEQGIDWDAGALPEMAGVDWTQGWSHQATWTPLATATSAHIERIAKPAVPKPAWPLPARHSFSTLIRGAIAGDAGTERAAGDEAASPVPVESNATIDVDPALQPLAGVRGTGIGNAFHQILEEREVGLPLIHQLPLVRAALTRHARVDVDALLEPVSDRLDAVLAAPLGGDRIVLGALPATALRNELEFHFSLGRTSLDALRAACAAHGEPELVPASHRAILGLMTGKIDLLFRHDGRFHVLDWKGNWLGPRLDDYRGDALARGMDHSDYRFQALLYTVALQRYLRQRLPDYRRQVHLGDAWYLFLRAVGTDATHPDNGVWRHRFDGDLLDAVDAALPARDVEVAA